MEETLPATSTLVTELLRSSTKTDAIISIGRGKRCYKQNGQSGAPDMDGLSTKLLQGGGEIVVNAMHAFVTEL